MGNQKAGYTSNISYCVLSSFVLLRVILVFSFWYYLRWSRKSFNFISEPLVKYWFTLFSVPFLVQKFSTLFPIFTISTYRFVCAINASWLSSSTASFFSLFFKAIHKQPKQLLRTTDLRFSFVWNLPLNAHFGYRLRVSIPVMVFYQLL